MTPFFNYDGNCYRIDSYYYSKGSPGKLYGPPESCYPAEPSEIEDVSLSIESEDGLEFVALSEAECEKLMDIPSFYEAALLAVEDFMSEY